MMFYHLGGQPSRYPLWWPDERYANRTAFVLERYDKHWAYIWFNL